MAFIKNSLGSSAALNVTDLVLIRGDGWKNYPCNIYITRALSKVKSGISIILDLATKKQSVKLKFLDL